jgi:hypothetical protein
MKQPNEELEQLFREFVETDRIIAGIPQAIFEEIKESLQQPLASGSWVPSALAPDCW